MPEPENSIARPTIPPYNYVIAGVLLVMGLIFGYLMSRSNASKGKLSMKIGSASVDMNVENDLQSMKALLDKVFKDENSRREMTALLGEFHKLYPVTDPKIVEEISKLSPENPVSKGLQNYASAKKEPSPGN